MITHDDRIAIATLGKTVGLKGEMRIHLDTDFPEQFQPKAKFYTERGELVIKRYDHERGVISFLGHDDINSVAMLTNQLLYTTLQESRERCKVDNGELFWFDVIGMDVLQEGEVLGKVVHIERMAGTDMMILDTDPLLIAQGMAKTFLIPYTDRYIIKADLESKIINVQLAKDILLAS
jgi:16S rRNA processing protein RimM